MLSIMALEFQRWKKKERERERKRKQFNASNKLTQVFDQLLKISYPIKIINLVAYVDRTEIKKTGLNMPVFYFFFTHLSLTDCVNC